MIRRLLGLVFIALVLFMMSCGSGNSPAGPGDNPPGNGPEVIIGTNPADWSCDGCSRPGEGFIRGSLTNGVFSTRDTSWTQYNPPYLPVCQSYGGQSTFTATRRINFRLYSSARLKFRAKRINAPSDPNLFVYIDSNVPGTSGLNMRFDLDNSYTDTFDVSLENALNLGEATLTITLRGYTSSSAPQCSDVCEVQIHDFQIVGQKL